MSSPINVSGCTTEGKGEMSIPADFVKGKRVRYVPSYLEGDVHSPECVDGVVSSVNDTWVFVKYDNLDCVMKTGDEPYTAQATDPNDLVPMPLFW